MHATYIITKVATSGGVLCQVGHSRHHAAPPTGFDDLMKESLPIFTQQ